MTGLVILTFAILIIGGLASVFVWDYQTTRNGEWHPSGNTMRRLVAGRWQYRSMSDSEFEDWRDSKAS